MLRSAARPLLAGSRGWLRPVQAARFSLKKPDLEADESCTPQHTKEQIAAAIKQQRGTGTPLATSTEKPKQTVTQTARQQLGKFVPFAQLPKPPKEIQDLTLDQFYAKVYMRDLPVRPVVTPSNVFAYNFEVPSQFIKNSAEPPSSDSSFEPAHKILEFKVDYDSNSMVRIQDHPLKESITGMFVSNPLMQNIDNDFLWDMYPQGKMFDNTPYGGDASFDGFKNWEKEQNEKLKDKQEVFESKAQEITDFHNTLNASKSFYRKAVASEAKAPASVDKPVVAKAGGRKKLDRALIKQYRKYKKEGYLRRRRNNDDDDEGDF